MTWSNFLDRRFEPSLYTSCGAKSSHLSCASLLLEIATEVHSKMAAQMTQPAMLHLFHAATTQGLDFCKPLPCSPFDDCHINSGFNWACPVCATTPSSQLHVKPFLRKLVNLGAVSLEIIILQVSLYTRALVTPCTKPYHQIVTPIPAGRAGYR